MSEDILNIYKPIGMTPLEALKTLKSAHNGRFDRPMTYAGRLDPMAEGVLILLSGEEIKNKQKFLDLNKTYTAQILFGLKTDSLDMLGIAELGNPEKYTPESLKTVLNGLTGTVSLPLPAFSSVPHNGKPLFAWAREQLLDIAELPRRKTEIFSLKLLKQTEISGKAILEQALENISKVSGDFRQACIQKKWMKILLPLAEQNFPLITIEVKCSSGTYIRALAKKIGEEMNTEAVLFSLRRDAIGSYNLQDSLRLPI